MGDRGRQRLSPAFKFSSAVATSARASGRGRDRNTRPLRYLTKKEMEAPGVGLPRSSDSRTIRELDGLNRLETIKGPGEVYKTGTADPPPSTPSRTAALQTKTAEAAGNGVAASARIGSVNDPR